jgi:hypothetical protein
VRISVRGRDRTGKQPHCIRHILCEGGKLTKDGRAFLDHEQPDICVFGHTYQPKVEWFGKTQLFNSGSAGPQRFSLPCGIGLLTIRKEIISSQADSLERQCKTSKQIHGYEAAQEKRREDMNGKTLRKRIVAAIMVGSFLTVTTACYGPFNLTRNVYQWNSNIKGGSEVNEKWMKEFVFFGMVIIPVYMFSALLDAFIFNSIQFWSGSNPIKANDAGGDGATRVVRLGGVTVTMVESDQGTTVTYERNGIVERRATIETKATGYRLIDETGALLAEAEKGQDGSVTLLDRDCQVVKQWTSDQLLALAGEAKN